MRALKTHTEPELLVPSLRTIATVIALLTASFLVMIIVAHLLRDDSSPAMEVRSAVTENHPPAATPVEDADLYPYSDPRTIGLY